MNYEVEAYEGELRELREQNKQMKGALAFYENVTRLMMDVRDKPYGYSHQSIMDNGDRARLALKKAKIFKAYLDQKGE